MFKRAAVRWEPKPYQLKALKFLLTHGGAGLLLDPGLGKTSIVLDAFRLIKQEKTANRMLVIAPLRVCYSVWPKEVEKWSQFAHLKVAVLHGRDKDKALRSNADIFCINPEGLDWLLTKENFKLLNADVLCVDESTRFKHTNTKRFKAIKPWLPKFRRRWILTGTPCPNGLMDIFGQVYLLDLGNALGAYITHFRNNYFDSTGFGGYTWVLKPGADKVIQEKIKPLTLRMEDRDWLELPKLVYNDIFVDLPPDAFKIYTKMEIALIAMLNDGTKVSAVNAGVAAGKCLQIANGGVYSVSEKGRESHEIHQAKIEAVEDLVEEISGQPALLLYSYEHDLVRLKKAFTTAKCVADYSAKKADALFDQWNLGNVELMMAQPQSIGHGLNLQGGGQHIIWFGMPWDLEIYLQAIKRLCRQGSKYKSIFVHHIIGRNTIDESVRAVLLAKNNNQKALLDALKAKKILTK